MKKLIYRVCFIIFLFLLTILLTRCDRSTNIAKENVVSIGNPNTFYYNSYELIDMSTGETISRYSESGSIFINGDLIIINRGSGTLTYIVRENIYNGLEQTYTFKTNKLDVYFDPTMKKLTISDECIRFNINSTIKSNW